MRLYKPGTTPVGSLDQTQRWLRTELARIEQAVDGIRDEFIRGIGYGEYSFIGPIVAIDLGLTWFDLDYFDTEALAPVGMAFDLVNGTFSIIKPGLWRVHESVLLRHDVDASKERLIEVRYYNRTTGQAVSDVGVVTVTRSSTLTTIESDTLVVPNTILGDAIVLQLRSPDGIGSVVYERSEIDAAMESPYLTASDVTRETKR